MADSADDDFFDALADRPPADLPQQERRRAEWLRAAILAHDSDADVPDHARQQELDRLLLRLRREGLLEKRRTLAPYAIAALLVIGIGALVLAPGAWMRGLIEEPTVIRGGGHLQVIEADNADQRIETIVMALRAQGIEAVTYPLGIHRGLNAAVPVDKRAAVAKALKPMGIDLPADGELRLEIRVVEKKAG
jgi:hypothetical protein